MSVINCHRLSTLPAIPNIRLLVVREGYAATILHMAYSIFPKRIEYCVDRMKSLAGRNQRSICKTQRALTILEGYSVLTLLRFSGMRAENAALTSRHTRVRSLACGYIESRAALFRIDAGRALRCEEPQRHALSGPSRRRQVPLQDARQGERIQFAQRQQKYLETRSLHGGA